MTSTRSYVRKRYNPYQSTAPTKLQTPEDLIAPFTQQCSLIPTKKSNPIESSTLSKPSKVRKPSTKSSTASKQQLFPGSSEILTFWRELSDDSLLSICNKICSLTPGVDGLSPHLLLKSFEETFLLFDSTRKTNSSPEELISAFKTQCSIQTTTSSSLDVKNIILSNPSSSLSESESYKTPYPFLDQYPALQGELPLNISMQCWREISRRSMEALSEWAKCPASEMATFNQLYSRVSLFQTSEFLICAWILKCQCRITEWLCTKLDRQHKERIVSIK